MDLQTFLVDSIYEYERHRPVQRVEIGLAFWHTAIVIIFMSAFNFVPYTLYPTVLG